MPWIIPVITAAASLGSAAVKNRKARLAEKEAENMVNGSPKYKPSQSILNYYDQALNRFNTSPTDTAQYKYDKGTIKQSTVQALSSLNKLRSGNVANIIQGQNNALLRATVNAENRKIQEFNVVGQAAQMKRGEDTTAFKQNELYPFEAKYNLQTMKAAGERAAQRQNTQNAYQNASAAAAILAGGDGMGGEGKDGAFNWNSIFGSKGQRSNIRFNNSGGKWWQN